MSDYESDILRWSERQADLLRRCAAWGMVNAPIDWENIAEEIEALGRSQRTELANRVATILVHLIKLQASPAVDPRNKWRRTVRAQRGDLARLLEGGGPTLRQSVPSVVDAQLPAARAQAAADMADYGEMPNVTAATFTADQVLGDWLP
jgi:hypothetical protein